MTVISYKRAQKQIEHGDLEDAEKTAASQLDRLRRAEIYGELAKAWVERGDPVRANELMNAAASEAAKVGNRGKRAEIYIYLAGVMTGRDAPRAFEFLEAAVGDINAAEKFDANGPALLFELQAPKGSKSMIGFSRSVSLVSVISPLAKTDLYRAITAARSLSGPGPRALSVIAACRDVLAADKKQDNVKKAEPAATEQPDKTQDAKKVKAKKQG